MNARCARCAWIVDDREIYIEILIVVKG